MKGKTYKLTAEALRNLIKEEAAKFTRDTPEEAAADTEELEDGGDYANTLEKHIDMLKALKIEESRLVRRLNRIREHKTRISSNLNKK